MILVVGATGLVGGRAAAGDAIGDAVKNAERYGVKLRPVEEVLGIG